MKFDRRGSRALIVVAVLALVAGGAWAFAAAASVGDDSSEKPAAKQKSSRGWLGVSLHDTGDGVFVTEVVDDSAAAAAGIEQGDRIVAIDGKRVEHAGEVVDAMRASKPGDTVTIEVEGDQGARRLKATLGERPSRGERGFVFDFDEDAFRGALEGIEGALEGIPHFAGAGEGEEISRGYLGVELLQPSDALRRALGGRDGRGVLIDTVSDESPAAAAGLRAGDLIVALDGKDVESTAALRRMIRERDGGAAVSIEIVRAGRTDTLSATLGEKKVRVWIWEHNDDGDGAPTSWRFAPRGIEERELDEATQERIREAMERAREAMELHREELELQREKLHDLRERGIILHLAPPAPPAPPAGGETLVAPPAPPAPAERA